MAIYLENVAARHIVSLYFECRRSNTYPAPGSWGQQTAYTCEIFEYIDHLRSESDAKNRKQSEKK